MERSLQRAGFLVLACILWSVAARAATFTSIASGNWNQGTTWNQAGATPGAADDVIIASAMTVTVTDAQSANSIVIQPGPVSAINTYLNVGSTGALTVGAGGINIDAGVNLAISELFISGMVTSAGPISFGGLTNNANLHFDLSASAPLLTLAGNLGNGTLLTGANGMIRLNGIAPQTIMAATYGTVEIVTSAAVNVPGSMTVDGTLTVNSGATLSVGAILTVNGDANISGSVTAATNVTFAPIDTLSGTNGSIIGPAIFATGGSRTITATNLQMTAVTVSGGVQNDGTVTLSSATGAGTWTQGSGSSLTIGGAFSVASFGANAAPNVVIFNSGPQTIPVPGGGAYHDLTLTGGGTKAAAGGLTVNGELIVDGAATFVISSTGVSVGGAITMPNGIINGAPGILTITGSTGSVTGGAPSAINVPVSVLASKIFNTQPGFAITGDVTIGSTATLTNAGTIAVNNVNGASGASIWAQDANSSVAISGAFLPIGTLTLLNTNSVIYEGTAAQNVYPLSTYHTLILRASGAKTMPPVTTIAGNFEVLGAASTTLVAPLAVGGNVTITSSAPVDLGTFTHAISGTVTITGASVNASAATLNLTAPDFPQLITLAPPVGALVIQNVQPKTAGNAWTVLGSVTINAGAGPLDGGGFTHLVGGNWSNAGAPVVNFNVHFNGAAGTQSIDASSFGLLQFSGGALKIAAGNITASDWIIQPAATFNAGTFVHTVNGNWTNDGTFNAATSTMSFNGAGVQTIGGLAATTFNNFTVNKSGGTLFLSRTTPITGNVNLVAGTFDTTTSFDARISGNVSGPGLFVGRAVIEGASQTWATAAPSFSNLVITGGGITFDTTPTVSQLFDLGGGNVGMAPGRHLAIAETATINRTSGFVVGELKLIFNPAQTRTFHVGTASGYAPVDVTAGGAADAVLLAAVDGRHPQAGPNSLGRFWNVTLGGTPASMTFHYLPTDVAGTETSYLGARFTGGSWTRFGAVNAASDNFTVTNAAAVGAWTAGEAAALGEPHWINPAGGAWSNGANWSSGSVPVAGDNVFIDLDGTYTVTLDVVAQVASLTVGAPTGTQTLAIPAAVTLTLDGPSTITANGILDFDAGMITGAGNLTNAGTINWGGGTFSGSGSIVNNATVLISGTTAFLDGKILANTATLNWSGTGDIFMTGGAVINNGGTFTIGNDQQLAASVGGGTVMNGGTLRKSAGGGMTVVQNGIALNSAGTIDIISGGLQLDGGGTISGPVLLGTAANELRIAAPGTVTLTGATISGGGLVNVTGGALNLSGATSMQNLTVAGGLVTGAGNLDIANALTLSGGVIQGTTGVPTVVVNGSLAISGSVTFDSRALSIAGTTNALWTAGNIDLMNGAGITNNGNLAVQCDAIVSSSTGGAIFSNPGNIQKAVTAGVTHFQPLVQFISSGNLDIQTGIFRVDGGGQNSGLIGLSSGAELAISAGTFRLEAGSGVTGTGKVAVSGGTLLINAPQNIPNLLLATGGTIDGPQNLAINDQFAWNGGTIIGPSASALILMTNTQIGVDPVTLDGRQIFNDGVIGWGSTADIVLMNGAQIRNNSTGIVRALGDRQLMHAGGAAAAFINLGRFEKAGGTGTTMIQSVPFTNSGVLDIQKGIVDVGAGFIQSGAGTLNLHLTGVTPGIEHGQLRATLPAFDGTIAAILGAFTPVPGNTFRLISAAAHSGDFLTRNYPTGGGLVYTDAYDSGGLLLTVSGSVSSLIVTTLADSGPGSLRQALTDVAAGICPAPCEIMFNVPAPGVIDVLTQLPVSNNAYFLNGTSQPGYAGTPLVGINGLPCGVRCHGLALQGSSTVAGIAIYNFFDGGAVWLEGTGGNTIRDSWVGRDLTGAAAGNLVGIPMDGAGANRVLNNIVANNTYGVNAINASSTNTVTGNVITQNSTAGVTITDGVGNNVVSNSISANGIGIDLGDDGPTANDAGDRDLGANNLQNTPVIASATLNAGTLTVDVSVDSSVTSAQSLQVQLFKADAAGQGMTLIGEQCFAGNSVTNAVMSFAGGTLMGGDAVVATATSWAAPGCTGTRGDGTSEFSPAVGIVCTPTTVSITAPPSVCANGTATASAPLVAGATYAWTIVNGTLSSPANGNAVTFVAGATGSVTLTLSLTNSCGATTVARAVIPINVVSATITASGPTTFCAGSSVTLTANAGGTGFSYLWSTGETTQSITVTAAGSYGVTVTDASGCSATAAPVNVAVNPVPTGFISGPASSCQPGAPVTLTVTGTNFTSIQWSTGATTPSVTVSPMTTSTYTVRLVSASGCTTVVSHTVTVGSGGGALTVIAPASVPAFSTGNTASVLGAGAGTYTWSVINGTITSGDGTPEITFTAGPSGSITINVTLDNGGCLFNGTTTVAITSCATEPPTLVSPTEGATTSTPATFSWTPVAGALSYEVWREVPGSSPLMIGSTAGGSTSLTAPVPSGTFSWFVIARLPQSCTPPALTSSSRRMTVAAGTNCPTAVPQLIRPASGLATFSPVTFEWSAVPDAIGYRLMASLGGLPAVEIETTDAGTTQVIAEVPVGTVTWWVEAQFAGCDPTRSADGGFRVQLEECSVHGAADLVRPADRSTAATSAVEFEWTAVDGADGYAVWTIINGDPVVIGSTVGDVRLTAVVPPGLREWWVETKFEGCPSTESAHRFVQIAAAANCPQQRPDLALPSAGVSVNSPRVQFSWSAVANALQYEVWLSVNGGSDALVAATAQTTAIVEVPPGEISWFVRARINGCPDGDSERRGLRYAPPAACSTSIPILLLPRDDGRAIASPATFRWTAIPGASAYRVYLVRGNGAPELIATADEAEIAGVVVPNGESRWFVEATFNGCPSTRSSEARFVAVSAPSSCISLSAPVISVPGQVSSGTSYTVQWTSVPGAESYLLTEFAGSGSSTREVSGQTATFTHPNTSSTPQTYVYHVRGIDNDCTPAEHGPLSAALGVTVLPARSVEGSTVVGSHATTEQVITLGPQYAGQRFTATPLQSWITVRPSSGTVPPGGIDLAVTADLRSLPLGTSVAGVQIAFGSGASNDRRTTHDGNTVNTSISVNLVTPVTPTPRSAPGPDALIIPAVAHAQGVNAQFQSDVRVTNTSAQVMSYQLTFVPTGEAGMTQGRQTSIDIAPGQTIALDDILRTWFGTGNTSVLGTLEVRPLTRASSSTSSAAARGVPNFVTFASSRTFNATENGTFGTYIPAIPFANFVGRAAGTTPAPVLSLQQIAQSDSYRTNLGLVEGSGNPAEVLVSVFNSAGTRVSQFAVNLNGGQHMQLNTFLQQRGIALEDGRVETQVLSGNGRVIAYAAVVNNNTGDSLVVTPVTLSETRSTKYVVPGVAELSAATPWQTDVRILNAGAQPVTATLTLQSLNNTAPQSATVEIAPRETKTLDRVLATLFGVSNDGGALHITTAESSNLIATARTYRPSGNGGNFGQFIEAVTPDEAIGLGSRPLQILQVEESQRFRSNIGIAEVTGKSAKVEISVIPPDAKVTGRIEVDLEPNQFRQINSLLSAIGLTDTHNARVAVRVLAGEGRVTAYAATIDQVTQDPTFIPAQ